MQAVQPHTVFGYDNRKEFRDFRYPWCTVGKIYTATGSCSGVMIGPKLLLTAQHCLNFISSTKVGWMKFTPAYYDGYGPYGTARAVRAWYPHRINPADGLVDNETAFDFAVVLLDWRIGDKVGYMGAHTYDRTWNGKRYWWNIGYPGDIAAGRRPVYTNSGAIASVNSFTNRDGKVGYVLDTKIDYSPGQSGGPLFAFFGNEKFPRVVGVMSTLDPNFVDLNEAAGGPFMTSLIAALRDKYD